VKLEPKTLDALAGYQKEKRKNFPRRKSNPGPLTRKVIALSIAPRHQTLNVHVKFIMFNAFAHEILPVDAVCSW